MIKYVIVDDEPIAHQIIEKYAQHLSLLHKLGNCFNAFEAIQLFSKEQVDLVFLDIRMPRLSGFELLNTLAKPPKVIITSAYQEHALQGYDYNVIDYLLKPFSFERFVIAVNKIILNQKTDPQPIQQLSPASDQIFIKGDKKLHQIHLKDILFVEALGNYCKIVLEQQQIITLQKISDLEKKLPQGFIRVHKSFLIAKDKINLIQGNRIFIGENEIPVGKTYRSILKQFYN